ncbi:MAG: hypothetical protein ACPGUT_15690 [Halocynthiibacter sp.]
MKFRKSCLLLTLTLAMGATSLTAGELPPPPEPIASSGSNAEKILIGAAIIGLIVWATGGFNGQGNSSTTRQAPLEDDGKGEVLMEF